MEETYFRDSFKGARRWRRSNTRVARKPRRRGKSKKRELSNDHNLVITVFDRQRQHYYRVLATRMQIEHFLRNILWKHLCCARMEVQPIYRQPAIYNNMHHIKVRNEEKSIPYVDEHTHEVQQLSLARVNSLHQTMKNWVNGRARGVSTAYLSHYLTWLDKSNRKHLETGTVYETTKTRKSNELISNTYNALNFEFFVRIHLFQQSR